MSKLGDEIVAGFEDWLRSGPADGLRPDAYGHRRCGWVGPALTADGRCPGCGEPGPPGGGQGPGGPGTMGLTLTLTRDPSRLGRSDEWRAEVPGLRPGIGRTRTEAKGSLLAANLEAFGIVKVVDVDPGKEPERLTWEAYNK